MEEAKPDTELAISTSAHILSSDDDYDSASDTSDEFTFIAHRRKRKRGHHKPNVPTSNQAGGELAAGDKAKKQAAALQ